MDLAAAFLAEVLHLAHKKPRLPAKYRLKEGEKICSLCKGSGNLGYPGGSRWPLGCHRCDDGVTWPRYEKAKIAWEHNCGPGYHESNLTPEERESKTTLRDKLLRELDDSKAEWQLARKSNLWIHDEGCEADHRFAKRVSKSCSCRIDI